MYVLGTYKGKMLYLAKVTNVVTMMQYYSGMSKGRIDNIYQVVDGELVRNEWLADENVHTEQGRIKRDLAGKYVILSDEYIYLGEDAVHIDSVSKYNARFRETKIYTDETALMIINNCMKYRDNKMHSPNNPYKKRGCR